MSNLLATIEGITRDANGDHHITIGGHDIRVNHAFATVDGMAVLDYYCSPCYWEAVQNGGANHDTGEGPCEHKALVAEARALVNGGGA